MITGAGAEGVDPDVARRSKDPDDSRVPMAPEEESGLGPGPLTGREVRSGRLSGVVPDTGEAFHALAALDGVRIEHIVSSAHPDPGLQAQDWDEWVLVLTGEAELDVRGEVVALDPGSWLLLPAGTPHRVLRTQAGTQWLAVHGRPGRTDDAGGSHTDDGRGVTDGALGRPSVRPGRLP